MLHELGPELVVSSPVCVGYGTVKTAHGTLPVPAPATANLLEGIPCFAGETESEMCTPTGAALLRHYVHQFTPMPVMTIEQHSYGLGTKEFEHRLNAVHAMSDMVWITIRSIETCRISPGSSQNKRVGTRVRNLRLWEKESEGFRNSSLGVQRYSYSSY